MKPPAVHLLTTEAGSVAMKCAVCPHTKIIPSDATHSEAGALLRDFVSQHAACADPEQHLAPLLLTTLDKPDHEKATL